MFPIWLSISIPLNIMAVDALLPGDGRDFIITLIWLMGFSIFGTFCWGLVSGKMWMATYGELYLFKLPSVESKWKSDKGMKVYVPHVAMLPYQGDCLYGSMTKKSSYYRMYTFDALDKFTSLKAVMMKSLPSPGNNASTAIIFRGIDIDSQMGNIYLHSLV